MEKVTIKYCTYAKASPPQPIRLEVPGWAGAPDKVQDGATGQPWYCLPFVEGSTYGLELVYPYETECHVVNDNGAVRFDWDFAREPDGVLTGGEFLPFAPTHAPKYYLFNARVDLQPPPGWILRTEPHPRYFTDETGTVPLAMIAHLQQEWYPRMGVVVFRAPRPGQRHIFRKGEPYVQLLFVPRISYETTPMSPEEAAQRRELEHAIRVSRRQIATKSWRNCDGIGMDNHYKRLAAAFAQGGKAGVEDLVRQAMARHEQGLPKDKPIPECLALGWQCLKERKYDQAEEIYSLVLQRDPNNAEALSHLGVCLAFLGYVVIGMNMMTQAVALQPTSPRYHSNLGEWQARLGQYPQAEASFRWALQCSPNDPVILSALGLTLALQGRMAEGIQACRAALALGPSVPEAHFRMALIWAQQGQYDAARACYEAALALDPGFADARRALQELPATVQP